MNKIIFWGAIFLMVLMSTASLFGLINNGTNIIISCVFWVMIYLIVKKVRGKKQ